MIDKLFIKYEPYVMYKKGDPRSISMVDQHAEIDIKYLSKFISDNRINEENLEEVKTIILKEGVLETVPNDLTSEWDEEEVFDKGIRIKLITDRDQNILYK